MVVYLDEYRTLAKAHWPYVPVTPWSHSPGIYVMFTRQRIMYVGITNELGRRLWEHIFIHKDNLRKRVQCRYWWCVVKVVQDRRVMELAEKNLIKRLHPVYNVQHNVK